jgi:WXXGXW repeat (2 copies)
MNRFIARWLILSLVVLSFSAASFGQIAIGISVRIGPPALPVYAQPICPGPGYFWTPGYWAWNDDAGYYWVPGTWVMAPVGLLWTPGYWGWLGGAYAWHAGYWGPHVGFYGGINYGFGYGGVGFVGGEWRGGAFFYNRSVTNVSVTSVTNVYTKTVAVNENHVAFNGGTGGIQARPTAAEETYAHERHTPALASQTEHEHMASQNRANFASENHGRPAVAATAKPGDFSARSAVAARSAGGEYHAPAMSPKEARASSPAGNRGGSNDGFHSFNESKNSAAENRTNQTRNNSENRSSENRTSESRSNENRTSEPRNSPARPENESHNSSQPKENSKPSNQHKSSPPPKKSSPPKEEHGKSR